MEFEKLLEIVGEEPVFETGLLLSGNVRPADVRLQLSRWTASGKIHQLRRGLYTLAAPYQKVIPHPFLVANRIQPNSYVSLQSALASYGMIPEGVPVTTSVTTGRPADFNVPLGRYEFRHIQVNWFFGYIQMDLDKNQKAFVARPEKALLDLAYLQPDGDSPAYLQSLRLQALDRLDLSLLRQFADRSGKPKLLRATAVIDRLSQEEASEYQEL